MSQVNIAEKLMVVRLNCSFSFGRVTDPIITDEVNRAKQTHALKVKKELFPGDSGVHLRALHAVLSTFYGYHKRVTMSSVNEGERLMPVAFYLDYMNEFGAYQALVKEAYDTFVSTYGNSIARAQQLLGPAHNAADYPAPDALGDYLHFKVQTLPLPQAGTLLDALGEGIQTDVDSFLSEAVASAFTDVNQRMKICLQRMVDQLSVKESPKLTKKGNPVSPRIFDSLTGNLVELVSFIPEFNVTEDDSLRLLADEVKMQLLVYSPDTLRASPEARQTVATKAAEILRKMG